MAEDSRYDAGMKVRRQVLGDAHVDHATGKASEVAREFQELITRYAWGEIWTRPGLDHRTRRILVVGTMVALGRWEEFRLHVRTALETGFALADLKEVLMQQTIYCGVPAANTAFHLLDEIVAELKGRGVAINGG
jgi:4-carboxymuconolactone decarboxylase